MFEAHPNKKEQQEVVTMRKTMAILALALALGLGWGTVAHAQDTGTVQGGYEDDRGDMDWGWLGLLGLAGLMGLRRHEPTVRTDARPATR